MTLWEKLAASFAPIYEIAGAGALCFVQGSAISGRLDTACMTAEQARDRIARVQAMLDGSVTRPELHRLRYRTAGAVPSLHAAE